MPTTADWVALAFPLIALATGAYRRFANQLKAQKWSELCQCNANPSPTCNTQQLSAGGWSNAAGGTGLESEGFRFTALADLCTGGWLYTGPSPPGSWTAQNVSLWSVTSATKIKGPQAVSTPGDIDSVAAFTWSTPAVLTIGQDYVICIEKVSMNAYPYKSSASMPSVASYYTGVGGVYHSGNSTLPATASGVMPGIEPKVCSGAAYIPVAPGPPDLPDDYPTPPTSSCGSYDDICAAITALDRRLQATQDLVVITQRYHVPMGYIAGTPHVITGTGDFAVARAIGFQVVATELPVGIRTLPGDPLYLWDVGWMAINDPSGMVAEKRVTRQSATWLPDDCQLATTFSYYLFPDVELTVTPLYAEP